MNISGSHHGRDFVTTTRWILPPSGYMKCNVDEAQSGKELLVG
uniref:Uncharacterized protein n=1 Tax=Brassica campestris TaxID=3711 RepID=A0A3P6B9H5_BRACM|nr:unnamed protein product [Brassica rapa]